MSLTPQHPRITPFLWFHENAEHAVDYYLSIFKNSRRLGELRSPADGKVITVSFELDGQQFVALNGGPHFSFTEAISFVVSCETQEEIDDYWDKLSAQGKESNCGWLKDKYGLSWQIVPANLAGLISDGNAFKAMMGMKKLNIQELKDAARITVNQ